jgi:hypothetical protein
MKYAMILLYGYLAFYSSMQAQCPFLIATLEPTYVMEGSVFLNGAGLKDERTATVYVEYERSGGVYLSPGKSIEKTCLEWSASYRLKNLSRNDTITYRYVLSYGPGHYATGGDMCVTLFGAIPFDSTSEQINITYFFHPQGERTGEWNTLLDKVFSEDENVLNEHAPFPNPVKTNSWLTLGYKDVFSIALFDPLGRLVMSGQGGGYEKIFIDCHPGVYFLVQEYSLGKYCMNKVFVH